VLATTVLAAGMLASMPSMAVPMAFDNRMNEFLVHIKADSSYKRIPLDTIADKQWFYDRTEALFTKKITKEQYVSEGTQRFPGYEASFNEVADFMTASK
jgi:hypothetical protein